MLIPKRVCVVFYACQLRAEALVCREAKKYEINRTTTNQQFSVVGAKYLERIGEHKS